MLHTTLYFFALISLSTSPTWVKLSHMPVDVLGFWRLTIASIILCLWVFVFQRQKLPRFERKFLWVLVSGFFFFTHLWTYTFAAKNTSIANTMIFFSTNPVWTTLASIFIFKESFTTRLALAYTLAITGIIILVSNQFFIASTGLSGDLSAIASAILFSAYVLTGKQARKYYSNAVYSCFQYLTCGLCFFMTVVLKDHALTGYDSVSWVAVFGLVLLPTLFGHLSFSYLMNWMNLSLMSCGKLIEPVLASILAYYIFAETLSLQAIIAFVFTFFSLLVLFIPVKSKTENKL